MITVTSQAALFSRPFIVRGGGKGILNRSRFARDQMLALAGHSKLNVVAIGEATTQPILPDSDAEEDDRLQPTFAQHAEAMRREAIAGVID